MEYIVGLLSKRRESLPNKLKITEASHKNQPEDTTIVVIGLGFVGLACFAGFRHMGYTVYGIEKNDIRKSRTSTLKVFFFFETRNFHVFNNFFELQVLKLTSVHSIMLNFATVQMTPILCF